MGWWQFTATSQFYLYGKKHCTATGYEANMKKWLKKNTKDGNDPLEAADLSALGLRGRVAMVTGANSGVGKELCKFLARAGATVYMVCRTRSRGEAAQKEILEQAKGNKEVHLLIADCGLEADVHKLWTEFSSGSAAGGAAADDNSDTSSSQQDHDAASQAALPRLDILVCNAGALLNEKTLTSEGVETTFACHLLFGTYLLADLARRSMEATPGSRVVVVSSGGMYNTKFPGMQVASGLEGDYEGNMAYAFAKRGQVLLCERWGKEFPKVKYVSCHPGWTDTPGVDDAYGSKKSYLEPLRTQWQGTNGIAWLCQTEASNIESGEFYLDRTPQRKHIAGPFFSDGTYTKNKSEEVDAMMKGLHEWTHGQRPDAKSASASASSKNKLTEMTKRIETQKFMGRWFVQANIPSTFEKGKMNCIEDYSYDPANDRIDVVFQMQSSPDSKPTILLQRATVTNKDTNTRWAINPKLGLYLPLGLPYLIVDCPDDYSTCVIGVPDRSYVWIMARERQLPEDQLKALIEKTVAMGFDGSKIQIIVHNYGAKDEKLPPYAFKDEVTLEELEAAFAAAGLDEETPEKENV